MEEKIFRKDITESEGKYSLEYMDGQLKKEGGAQASYNIPGRFFVVARETGLFKQDENFQYKRKEKDGPAYVLRDEYSLELGEGVLWLIGEEFKRCENKIIVSIGYKNNKPQMFKAVFKELNDRGVSGYLWFTKLYDKGITGSELYFEIDEERRVLIIDVKFKFYCNRKEETQILEEKESYNEKLKYHHNRILFGAPGTGKSYKLNLEKEVFGRNFERVTFHPNYSYGQFIGTYKPVPVMENGQEVITYKYVPGPFMRLYVEAINNPETNFALIIEEINRANVAAVFGDVFQLLDRKDGKSEYTIESSEDMRVYLGQNLDDASKANELSLPSNLYIWATMNSADQGVQPMDTAFKRRWNFEYIDIDENEEKINSVEVILGEENKIAKWNDIRKGINSILTSECRINEDKLLGPFFVSSEVLKKSNDSDLVENQETFIETFKNKVIMYLYEDAGKQFRNKIFKGCTENARYSTICKEFDAIGVGIFGEEFMEID